PPRTPSPPVDAHTSMDFLPASGVCVWRSTGGPPPPSPLVAQACRDRAALPTKGTIASTASGFPEPASRRGQSDLSRQKIWTFEMHLDRLDATAGWANAPAATIQWLIQEYVHLECIEREACEDGDALPGTSADIAKAAKAAARVTALCTRLRGDHPS